MYGEAGGGQVGWAIARGAASQVEVSLAAVCEAGCLCASGVEEQAASFAPQTSHTTIAVVLSELLCCN